MRAHLVITCLALILSQLGCDSQPLPSKSADEATAGDVNVANQKEAIEIHVLDDQDEITNGPWDNLFDLTLLSSPRSFQREDIVVFAGNTSAAPLKFKLNDLNGNGLLDPGESLSCIEPAMDTFGTSVVGAEVLVGLEEVRSGVFKPLGSAIWMPDN